MFAAFETRILEHPGAREKAFLAPLLEGAGLFFEGDPEVSVVLTTPGGEPVATGSL